MYGNGPGISDFLVFQYITVYRPTFLLRGEWSTRGLLIDQSPKVHTCRPNTGARVIVAKVIYCGVGLLLVGHGQGSPFSHAVNGNRIIEEWGGEGIKGVGPENGSRVLPTL